MADMKMRITDDCKNFGANPDDYKLLEDKMALVITFTHTSLEDNASQLIKIRKNNNMAIALLDLTGYMNTVLLSQGNIDKIVNGSPTAVLILELLQPPEDPNDKWSVDKRPTCKGVRLWYFLSQLKNAEGQLMTLYTFLDRYIKMNRKRSKTQPQIHYETQYKNLTNFPKDLKSAIL